MFHIIYVTKPKLGYIVCFIHISFMKVFHTFRNFSFTNEKFVENFLSNLEQ